MKDHSCYDSTAPNVAVIMIHGVADQKRSDTVHAGVDLLQTLMGRTRQDGVVYEQFEEESLRIPVSALPLCPETETATMDVGLQFMDQRCTGYQPIEGDTVYETQCFTTVRRSPVAAADEGASGQNAEGGPPPKEQGATARNVHFYELFWADLSRPSSGIWQWIMELYELTFLVAALGGDSLRALLSRLGHRPLGGSLTWCREVPLGKRVFCLLHYLARLTLVYALPLLNLAMAAMDLTLVTVRIPEAQWCNVASVLPALALVPAVWWLSSRFPVREGRWHMGFMLVTGVAAVLLAFDIRLALNLWCQPYLLLVLAMEASLLVWAAMGLAIWFWGRRLDNASLDEVSQDSEVNANKEPEKQEKANKGATRKRGRHNRTTFYIVAFILQTSALLLLYNKWWSKGVDIGTYTQLRMEAKPGYEEAKSDTNKMKTFNEAKDVEFNALENQWMLWHPELIHNSVAGVGQIEEPDDETDGMKVVPKLILQDRLKPDWLLDRTLEAAEWLALFTRLTWYLLFCLLMVMGLVKILYGLVSRPKLFRSNPDPGWQAWLREAHTALISICLPALIMMLLNIGVWRAAVNFLPVLVGPVPGMEEKPPTAQYEIFGRNPGSEGKDDVSNNLLVATWGFTIQPWLLSKGIRDSTTDTVTYTVPQPVWRFLQCFIPDDWRIKAETKDNSRPPPKPGPSQDAELKLNNGRTVSESIMNLLDYDGQFALPALLLLGLASIVAAWGLGRSIIAEGPQAARAIGHLSETHSRARALLDGNTLNQALAWLRHTGNFIVSVVCVGTFANLVIILFATFGYEHGIYSISDVVKALPEPAPTLAYAFGNAHELPAVTVKVLGFIVVAVIVGRARGVGIALRLSSVIDIALDVINWMRAGPLHQPPRARICARFYSLLEYLGRWRGGACGQRPAALRCGDHRRAQPGHRHCC